MVNDDLGMGEVFGQLLRFMHVPPWCLQVKVQSEATKRSKAIAPLLVCHAARLALTWLGM